jgi:hypothetical protein
LTSNYSSVLSTVPAAVEAKDEDAPAGLYRGPNVAEAHGEVGAEVHVGRVLHVDVHVLKLAWEFVGDSAPDAENVGDTMLVHDAAV